MTLTAKQLNQTLANLRRSGAGGAHGKTRKATRVANKVALRQGRDW